MFGFLIQLFINVKLATHVGAALAGHPEEAPRLVAIAKRESRLKLVGIHEGDRRYAKKLQPVNCPRGVYSTRGSHGQMARYALNKLPEMFQCSPWLIDIPLVSAYTATLRGTSRACQAVPKCRVWWERSS